MAKYTVTLDMTARYETVVEANSASEAERVAWEDEFRSRLMSEKPDIEAHRISGQKIRKTY